MTDVGTLEGLLIQAEGFLGLERIDSDFPRYRVQARGVGKLTLPDLIDAIRILSRHPHEAAASEMRGLVLALAALLDPRHAQDRLTPWMLAWGLEPVGGESDEWARVRVVLPLRAWAEALGPQAPLAAPMDVVWPVSEEALGSRGWNKTLTWYGRRLKRLRKGLTSILARPTRRGDVLARVLLDRVLSESEEVPGLEASPQRALDLLWGWHHRVAVGTLDQLAAFPEDLDWRDAVLEELRVAQEAFILEPFVEATATGARGEHLVIPELRGLLTRTLVRSGVPADRKPQESPLLQDLWGLVRRVSGESVDDALAAAVALQTALRGRSSPESLAPHAPMLVRLLGSERRGGDRRQLGLEFLIEDRLTPQEHDALQRLREHLASSLDLHFVGLGADQPVFDEDSQSNLDAPARDGLALGQGSHRQILVTSSLGRSAGPKPTRVWELIEEAAGRWPTPRLTNFGALLRDANFWEQVRSPTGAPCLWEPLTHIVNEGDAEAHVGTRDSHGWQIWLEHLLHALNEASRPAIWELSLPDASTVSQITSTAWAWHGAPRGEPVSRRRALESSRGTVQGTALVVSRGWADPPSLLRTIAPETCDASFGGDLRDPTHRDRLAAALLDAWESRGQGTRRATEFEEMLALLGATTHPSVGEPLPGHETFAEVRHVFDPSPVGTVIDLLRPALLFDGDFSPTHAARARVLVSQGAEPAVLHVLRNLAHRGHIDAMAVAQARALCASDSVAGSERVVFLGLEALETLQATLQESPDQEVFEEIRLLAESLAVLDVWIIPRPSIDGQHTRVDIEAELLESGSRTSFEEAFGPSRGPDELNQNPPGDVARILSFAAIRRGRLIRKGAWVKSLGRKPDAAALARDAVHALESYGAYDFLKEGARESHQVQLSELLTLDPEAHEATLRAVAVRPLASLLTDMDRVADLAAGIHPVRRALLAFLQDHCGVFFDPPHPLPVEPSGAHDPATKSYRVPGAVEGQIQTVLRRQATVDGKVMGRSPILLVASASVEGHDETWQRIDDLYRELRRTYRRNLEWFDRFFRARDRYLRNPHVLEIVGIVAAAESMGQDRLDSRDPDSLREAIKALERRLEQEAGLVRQDYTPGTRLPAGTRGYQILPTEVKGRAAGMVVRILEPAYSDASDRQNIKIEGKIMVTS